MKKQTNNIIYIHKAINTMAEKIKNHEVSIHDISDTWKKNEIFCLAVIKQNFTNFKFIDESLKNSHTFCLKAMKTNSYVYPLLNYAIQQDVKIACIAIDTNFTQFFNMSDTLRSNKEVCFFAIKKHASSFCFISESLHSDKQFLTSIIKENNHLIYFLNNLGLLDNELLNVAKNNEFPTFIYYAPQSFFDNHNELISTLDKMITNGIDLNTEIRANYLSSFMQNKDIFKFIQLKYSHINFNQDEKMQHLIEIVSSNSNIFHELLNVLESSNLSHIIHTTKSNSVHKF